VIRFGCTESPLPFSLHCPTIPLWNLKVEVEPLARNGYVETTPHILSVFGWGDNSRVCRFNISNFCIPPHNKTTEKGSWCWSSVRNINLRQVMINGSKI
jgi:hypothetical protein